VEEGVGCLAYALGEAEAMTMGMVWGVVVYSVEWDGVCINQCE